LRTHSFALTEQVGVIESMTLATFRKHNRNCNRNRNRNGTYTVDVPVAVSKI